MTFIQAKQYFGGYAAMAAAIGVTEATIRNWEIKGIPYTSQLAFQGASECKLRADKRGAAHALRK